MKLRTEATLALLPRLLGALRCLGRGGLLFAAHRSVPSYIRCRPLVGARRVWPR